MNQERIPTAVAVNAREAKPGIQQTTWEWRSFINAEGSTAIEQQDDAAMLEAGMDYLTTISTTAKYIPTPELIRSIGEEVKLHGEIRPDDSPEITAEELIQLRDKTLSTMTELGLVPSNENAYHNESHITAAVCRTSALIVEYNAGPQSRKISVTEARGLLLAAAAHDADHTGKAKRESSSDNFTAEQYAANVADAIARQEGMSVHVRQLIARSILSTSFWEHPTNPHIKPQTTVERILQQADIGGYVYEPEFFPKDKSFEQTISKDGQTVGDRESNLQWLQDSFNVAKEQMDNAIAPAPRSIEVWLKGQRGFLYYLRAQHDSMVEAAFPQHIIDRDAGIIEVDPEWIWEKRLREKEQLVEELMRHFSGSSETAQGLTDHYQDEIQSVQDWFSSLPVSE
ncbi:MAG: hypothetical protein COW24_05520 [Candidatus Kerfeldbacteria bacterium CG15_BIG_FIL_POST_REV_8_21_14_020_45_12]|uniref:Uncharacterized protein n=1 Tax=Candidatus Kerfeldbacteria bacterium CG15_BIG_FIL_POST_REV_8_21_14_020_45_12 TaxID=2014247 RepID=A0A2M7H2B4_9BACT|nr:MAG: hypothetical protein COW24_05520 [Candidatus Kerfeldbacteria bacterium CG15_BIG_FIL_POST_REV_8_21_14_020_45_12]PJA93919.1 MAG: hypothetical protein CO132_01040 [Candidatus Kerfeldbacteria bacterium CG_4_9_14_3_um_filter_45_8]